MRTEKNQTELPYKEYKIIKGSLEHRFFHFLNDLYKDYAFTSLRKYFKKHSVGAFRTGVLIELGFIEQIRHGHYIWIAEQPNVKDALEFTNKIREIQKEYNKKYIKKKRSKRDVEFQIKTMQNNSVTEIDTDQYITLKEAEKLTNKNPRTIRYHIAKYKENVTSEEQLHKMFKYKEDTIGNYVLYINKDFLNSIYPNEIERGLKIDKIESKNTEVKKIETKEKEIKSKHISLFWGMFKFEIKK